MTCLKDRESDIGADLPTTNVPFCHPNRIKLASNCKGHHQDMLAQRGKWQQDYLEDAVPVLAGCLYVPYTPNPTESFLDAA